MLNTDLGIVSIVAVGPYKAITWQADEDGRRQVIGLDNSGSVEISAVDTVAKAEEVLRGNVKARAAQAVAQEISPAYVDYLLGLPEDDRPSFIDREDGDDMENLLDDVRSALAAALMETDPYRSARTFDSGLDQEGFRPDIRLVHLLQRDQRDLIQEGIQRGLVGVVAHDTGQFLINRSPSLRATLAKHLPEALLTPDSVTAESGELADGEPTDVFRMG